MFRASGSLLQVPGTGEPQRRAGPLYDLTATEWTTAAAVAIVVVVVNKIVVGDENSSWVTLLLVAVGLGLVAGHLRRSLRRRQQD